MLPTTGMAKIKQPKGYADKTVADTNHVNSPFRDLEKGGHELNESYKVPAPNAAGVNHSYMHPILNPARENAQGFPTPKIMKISPLDQHGKGGK